MEPKFLIVRLSAIGDTILNIPIACALRDNFPNGKIGWVVGESAAPLLEGHPNIDRLFVLTKKANKSPIEYGKLIQTIRKWRPGIAIDAQGLTKSAMLAWLSGAEERIGFTKSQFEGREFSTWLNNSLVTPRYENVVQRGVELLRPLGVEDITINYRIPADALDVQYIEQFLQKERVTTPFAIINVGAGWVSKIWPSDRYANVVNHLAKRWSIPSVIVWAGDKELAAAQEIHSAAPTSSTLAPKTSLRQLAELIRKSVLFVGSDTGPMHLSVAVGTPTIGMIGPMPVERVGPLPPNNIALQRERLSSDRMSDRKSNAGPMLSITTEDVCAACDQLLSNGNR